jgi:uncharacterized Tic20 family protein
MNPPPLSPTPVSSNDKLFAILCHVSVFISLPFILPLIVYLVKRGESEWCAAHAREALNFHLSILLYCLCTIPLVFILIGIPIYIVLGVLSFICAIVAAIKASDGGIYHYPLTIRFIS